MNTTLAVLSLTALLAPVLSQAAEAPIGVKQYRACSPAVGATRPTAPATAIAAAVQAASSSAYARTSEENLKKKFAADVETGGAG